MSTLHIPPQDRCLPTISGAVHQTPYARPSRSTAILKGIPLPIPTFVALKTVWFHLHSHLWTSAKSITTAPRTCRRQGIPISIPSPLVSIIASSSSMVSPDTVVPRPHHHQPRPGLIGLLPLQPLSRSQVGSTGVHHQSRRRQQCRLGAIGVRRQLPLLRLPGRNGVHRRNRVFPWHRLGKIGMAHPVDGRLILRLPRGRSLRVGQSCKRERIWAYRTSAGDRVMELVCMRVIAVWCIPACASRVSTSKWPIRAAAIVSRHARHRLSILP